MATGTGSSHKLSIFVGSSSESKKYAKRFCDALAKDLDMQPWWHSSSFRTMWSTLASLQLAAASHDFGLFVFSQDDFTISRGKKQSSPRDNVVFEFGLFLGTLGPERVFPVIIEGTKAGEKVKLPSDLAGLNTIRLGIANDSAREQRRRIKEAADGILADAKRQGFFKLAFPGVREYGYDPSSPQFEMRLSGHELQLRYEYLRDKQLFLVGLLHDHYTYYFDETNICIGERRRVGPDAEDLYLRCDMSKLPVTKGDLVQCCLLLAPKGVQVTRCKNVDAMLARGCRLLARVGQEVE